MELSIFNFVVVHNRKIPRGLMETHEADLYLSVLKRISWIREEDNENDEIFFPCSVAAEFQSDITANQ